MVWGLGKPSVNTLCSKIMEYIDQLLDPKKHYEILFSNQAIWCS